METPRICVSLTLEQWNAVGDAIARAPVPWLTTNPLLSELTRQVAAAQAPVAQTLDPA